MKLNFVGDIEGLREGINELSDELGIEMSATGLKVAAQKSSGPLKINVRKTETADFEATIEYHKPIHFFRGLGIAAYNLRQGQAMELEEEPQFEMTGVMLDCSRNGVLQVPSVKRMLRKMSIMGLNMLMLYTEDTYTVEGHPYFGYMRGRYSQDELRQCDSCAAALGIEMIPCIQTLSHLEKYLRWSASAPVRDTPRTLLVDAQETYELLEQMITAASTPFRTSRIHIGMDEASDMGLGEYLQRHGYRDRFETITRHLDRVVEITDKHGLKPMMWSDMFFKFASPAHASYDPETEIPNQILEQIPRQVQQVYWRYGILPVETHRKLLVKHREICENPVFAGGVLTWGRFGTDYGITLPALENSLTACKQEEVKEVMVTLWGDDGYEGNYFTGLLGLQCLAEHSYAKEVSMETLQSRIKQCAGIDFQAFIDLSEINQAPDLPEHGNLAKSLLWQDPLVGLFDAEIEGVAISSHYQTSAEKLETHLRRNPGETMIFDVPSRLTRVLAYKGELGLKLKKAYQNNDRNALENIAACQLPELRQLLIKLKNTHREQWMRLNKPFGWEILDIRYGGLLARLDTAACRLKQYLDGEIERLEELEEERLRFADKPKYQLLASACPV